MLTNNIKYYSNPTVFCCFDDSLILYHNNYHLVRIQIRSKICKIKFFFITLFFRSLDSTIRNFYNIIHKKPTTKSIKLGLAWYQHGNYILVYSQQFVHLLIILHQKITCIYSDKPQLPNNQIPNFSLYINNYSTSYGRILFYYLFYNRFYKYTTSTIDKIPSSFTTYFIERVHSNFKYDYLSCKIFFCSLIILLAKISNSRYLNCMLFYLKREIKIVFKDYAMFKKIELFYNN
mmetsp:Transcript_14283/g.19870  ORF Transcript_14283/g.19870 Transcript_14283/m.19870 type:complete len:233 (+) Transcript_14283:1680-2378(+)